MQIYALKRLLKAATKYGVLFCHHNADPDSIFSANVLRKVICKINPRVKCDVVAVQGPSSLSKRLMEKVNVKLCSNPRMDDADFLVLVDTSTTQQLDEWRSRVEGSGKPILVVDHHTIHPGMRKIASLMLVDTEVRSTCEIVYELCCRTKVNISRKDALGLFLGILYETKNLRYASTKTFQVVAELLKYGVKSEEAFQALVSPMSRSERIARIKAASRLKLLNVGNWLLVSTQVGSYEASVARALLGLGADVVVVSGEKKEKVRVSLRSTPQFFEKTGIHLGRDVAISLGEMLSGMGSGHPTAAGVNGFGKSQKASEEAIGILREMILKR